MKILSFLWKDKIQEWCRMDEIEILDFWKNSLSYDAISKSIYLEQNLFWSKNNLLRFFFNVYIISIDQVQLFLPRGQVFRPNSVGRTVSDGQNETKFWSMQFSGKNHCNALVKLYCFQRLKFKNLDNSDFLGIPR